MTHSDEDRLFARFRATGDPEALGKVFDRTAPKLLLVAAHLGAGAAEAEDLVQTVFVQAIRDRRRWNPDRPVLPWLLGILTHRARDRQRTARRRREQGLATEPAAGTDPAEAAASRESGERIAEALDALPAEQRELLVLRLLHGLRAVDIAHARGVPPATVRTRLRRGLEALRRALPRGLAAPALAAWLAGEVKAQGRGLPAVREHVLATAAGVAPAALVAGGLAVRKVVAVGGLVLAACLGGLAWTGMGDESVSSTGGGSAVPEAAELDGREVGAVERGPSMDDAQEPDVRVGRSAVADATTTVIRGRVVDPLTGRPIPDVPVGMSTHPNGHAGLTPAGWRDPAPVRTSGDGRFRFTFVPPPALAFRLTVKVPGKVPHDEHWDSLRQGIEVDVGDLELRPGTVVRLRVLDEEGRPVPGLTAGLGRVGGNSTMNERTDEKGFAEWRPYPAGSWRLSVETHYDAEPLEVELLPEGGLVEREIVLCRPPAEHTFSGVVVDPSGDPLGGLEVEVPSISGRGHYSSTTHPDGTFLFSVKYPELAEGRSFWVGLGEARTDLEIVEGTGPVPWGTNGLRVVVRRRTRHPLHVQVVDGRTGRPLERYGVLCLPDRWRVDRWIYDNDYERKEAVDRPGGTTELALPADPYRLTVFPPESFCEQDARFVVPETSKVTLRVYPPAPLTVRVVDGRGEPLQGVEVVLHKPIPRGHAIEEVPDRPWPIEHVRRGRGGSTAPFLLLLTSGTTGDGGRVRLPGPAERSDLHVELGGARVVPKIVPGVTLDPEGSTVRLVARRAGVVQGRVVPPGFARAWGPTAEHRAGLAYSAFAEEELRDSYPELYARSRDADEERRTHLRDDGTFAFESLPPGRYRIGPCSPFRDRFPPVTVDVGTARPAEVVLDAGRLMPGRLTGRVLLDGEPLAGAEVLGLPGARDLETDETGRFHAGRVVPGRYLPEFDVDGGDLHTTEPVRIGPGGSVHETFELTARPLTLRVCTADGAVPGRRILLVDALDHDHIGTRRVYTDDGEVVLDHAPPGRLRLRAFRSAEDDRALAYDDAAPPAVELAVLGPDRRGLVELTLPRPPR